jgi:hypothetical protein
MLTFIFWIVMTPLILYLLGVLFLVMLVEIYRS